MRITIETGTKPTHKTTYQGDLSGRTDPAPSSDLTHRLQVVAAGAGTLLIAFMKVRHLLRHKKRR